MERTNATDKVFRLVGKYAVLLTVCYVVEYALGRYLRGLDAGSYDNEMIIKTVAPIATTIVLNLITWLLVARDRKKLGVRTSYVDLATILYRPVGVCAFLLYVIYGIVRPESQKG